MKHWKIKNVERGCPKGLVMLGGDMDPAGVMSIRENESGKIELREECDGYYNKECSKDEAIETLQEAIDWLRKLKC